MALVAESFQPRLTGLLGIQGRRGTLTEKNLAGYRRAQQAAVGPEVVDTKKFPAIIAQSVGRRLPDTVLQNRPRTEKVYRERNGPGNT